MPLAIVERNNWWAVDDFDTITTAIYTVLERNIKLVEKYRSGNVNVRNALVGQIMYVGDSHTFNFEIAHNILDWMLDYEGFENYEPIAL